VFSGELQRAYPTDEYYFVVVTDWDESRELDVYRELNYDRRALEGLDTEPGANKVISNDDFEMYAIDSAP